MPRASNGPMTPWPNWIRHLTTDQEIAGSSPTGVSHIFFARAFHAAVRVCVILRGFPVFSFSVLFSPCVPQSFPPVLRVSFLVHGSGDGCRVSLLLFVRF